MASLTSFTSFDTTPFSLLQWGNVQNPACVVIGTHGFCGAAQDFEGLATQLSQSSETTCIYAYNLRGMGLDTVASRVGDIEHPRYWIRDLLALTSTLRKWHPQSKIVWCGESLGALIALHACSNATPEERADAHVMLSPVLSLRTHLPRWASQIFHIVVSLSPRTRIPLHILAGRQAIQVTQGADDHFTQSRTNPWHVESFTLRMLDAIQMLIDSAPTSLRHCSLPSLLIHGGQDYFTQQDVVEQALASLPADHMLEVLYYENSQHLLLYDTHAVEIFHAIANWIEP